MKKESILVVKDLHKKYGPIKALNGVSFQVPPACVFGILGPNGSGKTTLLGIILEVLKSNAGSYEWIGYSAKKDARKRIGALLETPNFYHYLNAVDNLKIVAEIKNIKNPPIEEVLQKVNLLARKDSKFSTYSLGMKQRLAIASALLNDPETIVFDEPTNGLDPEGIAEIRNLIIALSQEGRTIIMASHLLDEVEKVCTHVAILKKGNLLSAGPVSSILNESPVYILKSDNLNALETTLHSHPNLKSIQRIDDKLSASFTTVITAAAINKYCFENNILLEHLHEDKQKLEQTFLELIK